MRSRPERETACQARRRPLRLDPMHGELTAGTVHAIYRQASRFIPQWEPRPSFFTG